MCHLPTSSSLEALHTTLATEGKHTTYCTGGTVPAPGSPQSKQWSQSQKRAVEAERAILTLSAYTAKAGHRAGYQFWHVPPRSSAPSVAAMLKARKVILLQRASAVVSATRNQSCCRSVADKLRLDKAYAFLNCLALSIPPSVLYVSL